MAIKLKPFELNHFFVHNGKQFYIEIKGIFFRCISNLTEIIYNNGFGMKDTTIQTTSIGLYVPPIKQTPHFKLEPR